MDTYVSVPTATGCRKRRISRHVAARILLAMLGCLAHAQAPVKVEDFRTGVPVTTYKRFSLSDIRVAGRSVKDLFKTVAEEHLAPLEHFIGGGLFGDRHTIVLQIANPEKFQQLEGVLISASEAELTLVLRDNHSTPYKYVFPRFFESSVRLRVELTSCDKLTHIVSRKIDELIRQQFRAEGVIERRLSLNEIFDTVLNGDVRAFLGSLDQKRQREPCMSSFEMLQWLKGAELTGFDTSEFGLNGGFRRLLEIVAASLRSTRPEWDKDHVNVRIIGFTDAVQFGTKPNPERRQLTRERTGIANWGAAPVPLSVYYGGCEHDVLRASVPIFVRMGRENLVGGLHHIGASSYISNNCGLGAARAYVTAAYLLTLLGAENITYEYATGGIHAKESPKAKQDATRRKVDVVFTFSAVRKN